MSKIIDITNHLKFTGCEDLVELARKYDELSLKYLDSGADIKDVAGIMANRLGELVRIFDGDKEALKGMLYNIIHDRTYLGEK